MIDKLDIEKIINNLERKRLLDLSLKLSEDCTLIHDLNYKHDLVNKLLSIDELLGIESYHYENFSIDYTFSDSVLDKNFTDFLSIYLNSKYVMNPNGTQKTESEVINELELIKEIDPNYSLLLKIVQEEQAKDFSDFLDCAKYQFTDGVFLKKLGEGTKGSVYLAELTESGEKRAIKIVSDKLYNKNESQKQSQLTHKNIVRYFHNSKGLVKNNGHELNALIMEYMDGETLTDLIKHNRDGIDKDRLLDYASQLLSGVSYLIVNNIFHKDLAPANIKLDKNGVIKIFDFGLASYLDDEPHSERAHGGKDDFSSLGFIIYRLATGHHLVSKSEFEEKNNQSYYQAILAEKRELYNSSGKLKNIYINKIREIKNKDISNIILKSLDDRLDSKTKINDIKQLLPETKAKKRQFRNNLAKGITGLIITGLSVFGYTSWKNYENQQNIKSETFFNYQKPLFDAMVNGVLDNKKIDKSEIKSFNKQGWIASSMDFAGNISSSIYSKPFDESTYYHLTLYNDIKVKHNFIIDIGIKYSPKNILASSFNFGKCQVMGLPTRNPSFINISNSCVFGSTYIDTGIIDEVLYVKRLVTKNKYLLNKSLLFSIDENLKDIDIVGITPYNLKSKTVIIPDLVSQNNQNTDQRSLLNINNLFENIDSLDNENFYEYTPKRLSELPNDYKIKWEQYTVTKSNLSSSSIWGKMYGLDKDIIKEKSNSLNFGFDNVEMSTLDAIIYRNGKQEKIVKWIIKDGKAMNIPSTYSTFPIIANSGGSPYLLDDNFDFIKGIGDNSPTFKLLYPNR